MNILETTENKLLDRKEIFAEIESVKTPSFNEVKDLVSAKLKADKENIAVKEILGSFGRRTFKITVFVYDTKEAFEKTEGKKEKSAEAKPAEAAPAA